MFGSCCLIHSLNGFYDSDKFGEQGFLKGEEHLKGYLFDSSSMEVVAGQLHQRDHLLMCFKVMKGDFVYLVCVLDDCDGELKKGIKDLS